MADPAPLTPSPEDNTPASSVPETNNPVPDPVPAAPNFDQAPNVPVPEPPVVPDPVPAPEPTPEAPTAPPLAQNYSQTTIGSDAAYTSSPVPEPPLVPNVPAPNPVPDPPSFGINSVPNVVASNDPGMTTATILPVGSGGPDLVSYSSSGGVKRFLIPALVGLLLISALGAGAYFFFSSRPTDTSTSESQTPTADTSTDTSINPPANSAPEEPTTPAVETETYTNNEFNFTIDYPQKWGKKEAIQGNVVAFTEQFGTGSPATISIMTQSPTTELTALETSTKRLNRQLHEGLVPLTSNPIEQGDLEAIELENTYPKGSTNRHNLQLLVVRNGVGFVITAESDEEAFAKIQPTFKQVFASLAFSN